MAKQKDTQGKPVSNDAIPMHKRLAMGEAVETGAGKGAEGGKSGKKSSW